MNKIAIIFGATGGIGSAVCETLSSEYKIVEISRKEIDFNSEISYNQIQKLLIELNPDLIVNCVGHFTNNNNNTHNKIMNINFGSNWSIIKFFVENTSNKPIKIIMIGSSAHREGRKNYMLYAASKAALYNLWLSSSEYFMDSNVSISIINPVKTKTKMMDKSTTKFIMPEDVAKVILSIAKDIKSSCIDLEYPQEN
jgi:short-subunit dehydrogenase